MILKIFLVINVILVLLGWKKIITRENVVDNAKEIIEENGENNAMLIYLISSIL